MNETDVSAIRRTAGIASVIVLASSSAASWIAVLFFAFKMPTFPVMSVTFITAIALATITAAVWLGKLIWNTDARWTLIVLLVWAILKQAIPNLLYPSVFPRIVYMVAMSAAIVAMKSQRKAAV